MHTPLAVYGDMCIHHWQCMKYMCIHHWQCMEYRCIHHWQCMETGAYTTGSVWRHVHTPLAVYGVHVHTPLAVYGVQVHRTHGLHTQAEVLYYLPSCTLIATGRKGLPRETSFNIPKTGCHHSSSKPSHPNFHHVTFLSPTRRRLCQALTVTSDKRYPAPSLQI